MKIIFVNFLKIYSIKGEEAVRILITERRMKKQDASRRKTMIEEEGKKGEVRRRSDRAKLKGLVGDPPPCSARLVITRQGRREREASKSPYGPLFLSHPSFGLA